jgi:endoglycosylceramidase
VQGALELRRKIFEFVILLLFLDFLIAPTLSLQSIQKISASGIIEYGRERMKWLRTNGKWVVDEDGNIVILRGVNFHGYEVGAFNEHTEADYERIRSWGFNVVRLPIAWSYIEPTPGFYNDSYFSEHVDKDIMWAKKHGLYIILDMHQWKWSPYFTYPGKGTNGMPVWLVNGYPNSEEGKNQAVADFWLGKGPNGTDATPTNPSMQDRYIKAWRYVASRYSNESTIIAFDLFNEPPDTSAEGLTTSKVRDYLFSFYERLIDSIRAVDSNHIIIYQALGGGAWWAKLLDKPNIVFSTHYYDLDQNYSGDKAEIEEDFLVRRWNAPKDNPIKNWNIPIIIGEFGYNDDWANCELWVRDVTDIFDKYQLKGYLWWTYFKSDTYGKALLRKDGTERVQVKYLDRPYPRIITFIPLNYSFNYESKEFLIIAPAGNHTVKIYLPQRHYPAFTVNTNATKWCQIWENDDRILTLTFNSSTHISIIIEPSM